MWPPVPPSLSSLSLVRMSLQGMGSGERAVCLGCCPHLKDKEMNYFFCWVVLLLCQMLVTYRVAHICRSYLHLDAAGSRLPII